jgi:hypothetical protein
MEEISFYFKEGWQHIISLDALDHQLFLVALVALYKYNQVKQLLILVTAFTIGHCATLALSVYQLVTLQSAWVEFLIPCTIVATGVVNLFQFSKQQFSLNTNYFFALFFGLIHGLGFANTLKVMIAKTQSLGWSLFGFNLGLEVGQIAFVSLLIALNYILVKKVTLAQKYWTITLSVVAIAWAAWFAVHRFPA